MNSMQVLTGGLFLTKPPKQAFVQEETVDIANVENEQQAQALRKAQRIRVYGTDVPLPITKFAHFKQPTPIQMQAIPILGRGRDLIACAPTGSGKTLAYLFPIEKILLEYGGIGAVILTPTRELASQVEREYNNYDFKMHAAVLSKHVDKRCQIIISTPKRLIDAVKKGTFSLDKVKYLVLDEADKLLDLGFLEQIDDILSLCTSTRLQKALFSATIPSGVEQLAKTIMVDPLRIVIGQQNAATETIDQKLLYVGQESGKLIAIRQLIQGGVTPPVLIFVQSIERAQELFHELVYDSINVDCIHSERTAAQRDLIVQNFRTGKTWVLICTELMGRGIDFKGVKLVINYDFPQSSASYIHRIGRTGRAGSQGKAVTYFTKDDLPYLKSIVNVMKDSGCDVPEWMLLLKKPTKNLKKNVKQRPVEREAIKTSLKMDENKRKKKTAMVEASKRRKLKLEA